MRGASSISQNIRSFLPRINKIFYSNIYFALLLFVSFTCWMFDESLLGIYVLLAIGVTVLILNEDISPVLPILALMLMCISDDGFMYHKHNMQAIIISTTLFAVAFVFNMVFYRHRLRLGKVGLPLILVCVALFMGGIGSEYMNVYTKNLMYLLGLGPLMLGVYIACVSAIKIPKDIDYKMHFSKIIVLIVLLSALQVIVAKLRLEGGFFENFRDQLLVGWSNRAGIVILITLGLSSAFYIAENTDIHYLRFPLFLLAFGLYAILMITCSRGGMIFGTLEIFMITIYMLFRSKHRIPFLSALSIFAIVVCIIIGVKFESVKTLIESFKDLGFNSSGRVAIFEDGIRLFGENMIFGVGFGYTNSALLEPYDNLIFFFHSTPIQILANMGIFGAICYGVYYIARIKVLSEKVNPYNIMMTFALVCFEVHSLIDAGTFEPLPFLYAAILINTFVEISNEEDEKRAVDSLYDAVHSEA